MTDRLAHYHLFDYKARAALCVTTELTREAQKRHGLDPLTTIAVGRAMACAAVLASVLKVSKEYFHLSFAGQGLIRRVVAECSGEGHVRGYSVPARIIDVITAGQAVPQSVGAALGTDGMLTVTRGKSGDIAPPYNAVSAFMNGEIAADVARFLTESEQVPSAVAAGVKLAPDGEVVSAGAILVQRLGGSDLDDHVLDELGDRMQHLHLSERIARGESFDELMTYLQSAGPVGAQNYGMLTERPLQFKCTCTRERMANALFSLGEAELKKVEAEQGKLEIRCHYCSTTHTFKASELAKH